MGKEYGAFIAGLPEIAWEDRKLSLTLADFREQADHYMEGRDKALLNMLFLPYDNRQVLKLLDKHDPDPDAATVYPLRVLEEEVLEPEHTLPSYLNDFIVRFKEGELHEFREKPENVMSYMYYAYLMNSGDRFLAGYAEFSLNLKNLLAALNSKKYGKEIAPEIVGSNEFAYALKSAHSKDFGLAVEFPWVEKVIRLIENDNLAERERGLDLLVWEYVEEQLTFCYFSIERVLGFAVELMIVERWSRMDFESGREVFRELVEKFRKNPVFEKQFA